MSLTLTPASRSLVGQQRHRLAKLWEILRQDGEFLRFTEHSQNIDYLGQTYTPAGGGDSSAKRRQSGLEETSADFMGVLNSSAITFADLWAGRYREARVTETLIDWRYPWKGATSRSLYFVLDTTFDGERWTASLGSFASWLQSTRGQVYGRTCGWTLYDQTPGKCGVSQGLHALSSNSATVSIIDTAQRAFHFTDGDNYLTSNAYNGGHLIWLSGANVGLKSQIKTYFTGGANHTIELELATPLPIAVDDLFNAWRGCDKLFSTCKTTFSNAANFHGFRDIPGTDRMLESPTT